MAKVSEKGVKSRADLVRRQNRQSERNLEGVRLETAGKTAEAIALYEANVVEGLDGNHPYDRLAVLYQRAKRREDEIRILKRAVLVFEEVARSGRTDGSPKLARFRQELLRTEADTRCEGGV